MSSKTRTFSRAERRERVSAALTEVGLKPMQDRYPHEFSGGQRQRIAVARAVILSRISCARRADKRARRFGASADVDLLRDLQQKRGLAYLFISHDLKVMRALASYVIVMRNGVVVEEGPTADIFEIRTRITPRRLSPPRSITGRLSASRLILRSALTSRRLSAKARRNSSDPLLSWPPSEVIKCGHPAGL